MYDPHGEYETAADFEGSLSLGNHGNNVHSGTSLARCTLLLLLSLPLAGCGLTGYFTSEDQPEAPVDGSISREAGSDIDSSSSAKRSGETRVRFKALDLESLEKLLCERHPALVGIRQEIADLRQQIDPSWLPGARWSDSDSGPESGRYQGDRQIALDWSPGALSREERQKRQSSSQLRILSLQLEETRNQLLLDLRQLWSDYWLHQQQEETLSSWLTRMEVAAESDVTLEENGLLGRLEQKVSDWNRRIAESSRLKYSAVESINEIGSRPGNARLAKPAEPGDLRFAGIEDMDRHRRHPSEILASERGRYSRTEIDYSDPRTWDGLVIGAQTRQDPGQPVASSGQGSKSGDWILTVGVEIPLGADEEDRFRRQQVESAGSRRLELVRIRKQIQNRIESSREQVRSCDRRIDGYLRSEPTVTDFAESFGALLVQLVESTNTTQFEDLWAQVEVLLAKQLDYQQAVADRAVGRFQLAELLVSPLDPAATPRGFTRSLR